MQNVVEELTPESSDLYVRLKADELYDTYESLEAGELGIVATDLACY